MNAGKRIAVGLVSIEPLVFSIGVVGWLVASFGRAPFASTFPVVKWAAGISAVVLIALTLFYGVLLTRRTRVSLAEKIGVPLAILFSNGIILPLVWWVYVWRPSDQVQPTGARGSSAAA